MEAVRRVCPFSTKTWPTSIQLERHRRTESHCGSRSGRGLASWRVGPTSEVRLQNEDRGDAWSDPRIVIDLERPRVARSVDLPRDSWPRRKFVERRRTTMPRRRCFREPVVREDASQEHLVILVSQTVSNGRSTILDDCHWPQKVNRLIEEDHTVNV